MLDFILWEIRPEVWPDGPLPVRWYGLFFAMAFVCGQFIITYIFRRDGRPVKDVDTLTYYMIAGTVIGARLGHCLFYQPDYYLANPIEILKVWEGGLASHGATFGIITALWLYSRNRDGQSWLWILDRIVIVVALGGFFIRMGNLMNSEIIGRPSSLPWAMVFLQPLETSLREAGAAPIESVSVVRTANQDSHSPMVPLKLRVLFRPEMQNQQEIDAFARLVIPGLIARSNADEELVKVPVQPEFSVQKESSGAYLLTINLLGIGRHPAMVYEALSTLFLFLLLFLIWINYPVLPQGRLFGLFVTVLFSLRFAYEFLKENQVDFEDGLLLNMGQVLSIPLFLAGVFILIWSFRQKEIKK